MGIYTNNWPCASEGGGSCEEEGRERGSRMKELAAGQTQKIHK